MKRPPFKNPHDLLAVGGTIKRPPFKNPHSLLAVGIFLNSDILIRKAAVHLCERRQLIYTVPAPCSPEVEELGRIENIVCHVIYFADFRKLLLFEVVKIRAILL